MLVSEADVKELLPLVLTGLAVWGGYKVLSAELPAFENAITSRLPGTPSSSAPTGTGFVPQPIGPAQPTTGSGPCSTPDGMYWTLQTSGVWYGRPYCPPGVPCPQFIRTSTTRPC